MRPARVLWLAKGLGLGGTEHRIARFAGRLDRDRFHLEVAYTRGDLNALVPTLSAAGVPTHLLGATAAWPWRLRRLVADRRYDLVHTYFPMPGVVTRAIVWRPALVHTEPNVWTAYHPLTRWANALTYWRNAHVFTVSAEVARTVRRPVPRLPMPPVEVLIHGIDLTTVRSGPEARARARAALGVTPDELVVGCVANLDPKKDLPTLLTAAARLAREDPRLKLVIVGPGPLHTELEQLAARLGIGARVALLGPRRDVADLLAGFDVFALTSRHEGLPNALVEALATGVPAVATAVGGVPEVLEDGVQGFLVPSGDPDAVANAIGKLLGDDRLRRQFSAAAARRGAAFDMTAAVGRLEEAYGSILGQVMVRR